MAQSKELALALEFSRLMSLEKRDRNEIDSVLYGLNKLLNEKDGKEDTQVLHEVRPAQD